MVRALAGAEVTLACLSGVYGEPEGTAEREEDGVLQVRLATPARLRNDQHRLRWAMADPFRKFVEKWRPELVHFHHLSGYSADFPEIARRAGAMTALTLSDLHLTCPVGHRVDYRGDACDRAPGQGCLPCVWEPGTRRDIVARLARSKASRLLHFSPVTDVVADWSNLSQRSLDAVDILLCSERAAADMDRFGLYHPWRVIEPERNGNGSGTADELEAQDETNDEAAAERLRNLYRRLLRRAAVSAETTDSNPVAGLMNNV
jgi:hypothetical protein